MNTKPSEIEINGKRYDAVTGQLIGAVKKAATHIKTPSASFSMDGIMHTPAITKLKPASSHKHPKRAIHKVSRSAQKSRTLMRNIVKKPAKDREESHIKTRGLKPDHVRSARAERVMQHPNIKRFGIISNMSKGKRSSSTVKEGEVIAHRGTMALATATPQAMSSPSQQKLERLLDYALAKADAHKKVGRKNHRGVSKIIHKVPRWLSVLVIAVGLLGATGFYVWNKVPSLSMKIAASRAHVDTSVPNLPGYSIATPAKEKNGVLSIELKAEANPENTVTVTKKAVNPNDTPDTKTLAAKACPNDNQVQTFEKDGATSIICGETNKAAGIVNGVMTEIQANGSQSIIGNPSSLLPSQ